MSDPDSLPKVQDNADPLTGQPGSHPVATGLGTAGAGVAGAVIGAAVGGPVGTVVGTVIGAVAGAFGGHALGEAIDPTAEEAYWRTEHQNQPYAEGTRYEDYEAAYRTGYEGAIAGPELGSFEDAEPEMKRKYESGENVLPWIKVRVATQSAWSKVRAGRPRTEPPPTSGGVM
jgi:hypothetical protein